MRRARRGSMCVMSLAVARSMARPLTSRLTSDGMRGRDPSPVAGSSATNPSPGLTSSSVTSGPTPERRGSCVQSAARDSHGQIISTNTSRPTRREQRERRSSALHHQRPQLQPHLSLLLNKRSLTTSRTFLTMANRLTKQSLGNTLATSNLTILMVYSRHLPS